MTDTAFLFPGQGSQAVGMGRSLHESFSIVKETFQEVDEALKHNLSRLMLHGPEFDLNLTENTQPAIMACSVAALRVMRQELGNSALMPVLVAGHSLGEYSALVAAGSLSLTEAARLLQIRGRAMQKTVPVGQGAMAAIIGLDIDTVREVCADQHAENSVCEIANHNSDQQVVISGHKQAVTIAIERLKDKGAKRAVMLPVSAPFHCSLMQPAGERMAEALADAPMENAAVPLVANVTAQPEQEAVRIKELLVLQVTGMVRWCDSMAYLNKQGVEHYIEIGHGKILTGLLKRMAPDARLSQMGAAADLDTLVK